MRLILRQAYSGSTNWMTSCTVTTVGQGDQSGLDQYGQCSRSICSRSAGAHDANLLPPDLLDVFAQPGQRADDFDFAEAV